MKALFSRQSLIIAAAAVLIAIISIVSVNAFSTTGPVTGLANAVSRPIRNFSSTVTGVFERIYASIYRYDDLMERYERNLAIIAEYERNERDSEKLAAENEVLRRQLLFRARNPGHESDMAVFQGWSASNWSSSFIIDRGYSNSNIQRGNAVTTEYGVLIGQVTDVGATTSTVVTILDTTFSAGVHIGDGHGAATLRGDFNLMSQGLMLLDRIDDDQIVLPGAMVVTSGTAGMFPPELVVGEIIEVHRHNTGVGRYAIVSPMRVMDSFQEVFVITGYDAEESGRTYEYIEDEEFDELEDMIGN